MLNLLKSKTLLLVQFLVLSGLIALAVLPMVRERQHSLVVKPALTGDKIDHQAQAKNVPVKRDNRTQVLKSYLAKYDSPLQNSAEDFVKAADAQNVDWKLVPAIAGVESTFGKQIPGGFNGWGWGVYGDQAIYFSSWKEAIYTITAGLKSGYIDKGLHTPYQMNRVYAASPTWGTKVNYFMNDLDRYAKAAGVDGPTEEVYLDVSLKVANGSARLTNSPKLLAFAH